MDAHQEAVAPSPEEAIHPDHFPYRLIVAGIAGNVMEWYDFAVYGYFAVTIGNHFFPSDNPSTSLIAAFGAFAAGFLMRPLGGVVFGHIGDRFGRKVALTLSVLAMAIPTFLIGVLPGYQVLGATAAVLLVLLRMIQGLSVGGEYTTSIVFLVEGAGRNHHGFAASWSGFGAVGGILLGSAVGAVVTGALPQEAVQNWAWRVPFLIGLFVGLAGLYVRNHIPEPPRPEEAKAGRSPIWTALRSEWRTILHIALLNTGMGIGFYTGFVFLVTYMQRVAGLSEAMALEINTVNMVVLLAMFPLSGWLSDRVGRAPMLIAGMGATLVLCWPLFWALQHHSSTWNFVGQLGFAICIGLYGGVIPVAMVEMAPPSVRCSSIAIGYNLCIGLLGGTTPMVATWLIRETQSTFAPAWYLMAAALVSLAAVVVPLLIDRQRDAAIR